MWKWDDACRVRRRRDLSVGAACLALAIMTAQMPEASIAGRLWSLNHVDVWPAMCGDLGVGSACLARRRWLLPWTGW